MPELYLSVIIPAYNEEKRIGDTIRYMIDYLRRQNYASEIIVVDDGSRDRTVAVAEKSLADFRHTLLKNEINRGKGYSVRRGMLEGRGKFLLFSDADMSTPIEEVEGFIRHLESGEDAVIASRAVLGARVEKHQPFLRENLGRVYNVIARLVAFQTVMDSQCGFKCFKREVARDLFGRQKLERFSFDAEIVYLAQRRGYKLIEKPVIWRDSPAGRVKMLTDPLNMLTDLVRIRWLHRDLK
ncbi:MAG: glycosyltransferase family 2 protein [Candidatus Omnitrophica bacterium]|nr:glycosyltransferase family 2 protein [Candidatus Omnitrophota bacterium]MDD5671718.1 glycosyltransferase family 2 protein [Candidatus Omnitrophota bacterium]